MFFIFNCSKEWEQIVHLCKLGKILWRACFISVTSLAVQTLKLLKLLQGWSLPLFLGNYFQSGYLCAWQAFPRVYFTAGQEEIDSFSNLWFVINSFTRNKSMYQCSDWGFTDRSEHSFVLLGSFLTDTATAVLGWQGTAPCSLCSYGDSRCFMSFIFVCGIKQSTTLAIGLLGLLEPWLMYFTLFWGQCHFSGGRAEDFQTTAFQWIDSASLKVISAGETISTLVPGRQTLLSGCWCHVSLWMNISCAASPSTSSSPVCSASLLCVLALPCPLHLSFLYPSSALH